MATILLSILIFGLIMTGMAVGLIFRGKSIKGSCGGMSALGMDTACDICGGDTLKCEKEQEQAGVLKRNAGRAAGFYEA